MSIYLTRKGRKRNARTLLNLINYYKSNIESTNECLVTCSKNLEEPFAFPIDSSEPKKCISKCPKYYITKYS